MCKTGDIGSLLTGTIEPRHSVKDSEKTNHPFLSTLRIEPENRNNYNVTIVLHHEIKIYSETTIRPLL